tara:strand:+ start:690 stop:797 length:108 start_codon:yes stop_codon:yes gene_type:complete
MVAKKTEQQGAGAGPVKFRQLSTALFAAPGSILYS